MNRIWVLYIDELEKINDFLRMRELLERNDIVIFTASNKNEAIRIAKDQKNIRMVVLTKHVYRDKSIPNVLRKMLGKNIEFIGVSSAPEIRDALGAIGCNLVFEDRHELLKHIPAKHPDANEQADQ